MMTIKFNAEYCKKKKNDLPDLMRNTVRIHTMCGHSNEEWMHNGTGAKGKTISILIIILIVIIVKSNGSL